MSKDRRARRSRRPGRDRFKIVMTGRVRLLLAIAFIVGFVGMTYLILSI